ncbi:nucleoside phosphorylase [Flagellimonas nanhaiensis]|uniref:Uridine phosphorylase n=1 Tax=Flagellimonas nanhaiensis TaxID=2292706 RepID=A0A371JUK9_9FLAO|nr:nucleoside phosphorylase [Allomuricauda nanhaiensis]RDY61501.1 phosphorylase [Allomuricauda nanhaiensis]
MPIGDSELILNPDGSIYHLNLLPEDIATTIITVGDPNRVRQVSKFFDSIELQKEKREFITHTGHYQGKRISVISTGIGTDNIDIVFNELDALANIDFKTREVKEKKIPLDIIRIGTSGAIQPDIPIDSFVLSASGIGLDSLLHFYDAGQVRNLEMEKKLNDHLGWKQYNITPYAVDADENLVEIFSSNRIQLGITATNSGFYGPQGRTLRLPLRIPDFHDKLASFSFGKHPITNLEMETSSMYGLAKLHGHRSVSLNVILANRPTREFSKQGYKSIDNLIEYALEKLIANT